MKAIDLSQPPLLRLRDLWQRDANVEMVQIGLLVAIAYYAGAQLGFVVVYPHSPLSIIWPPNAILLAALLLVPTRLWWVLLLAVLPAHLLVEWQNGVMTWTVLGLYFTNCGEALLGAVAVRRFASGPPWLSSFRQVAIYIACAAIAAPFVFSFLDTGVIVLTHWGTSQNYWVLWQERFISAVLTYLTVPPVILIGASSAWDWLRTVPWRRALEAALLAVAVLGTSYVVFTTDIAQARDVPALLYLLAPVVLWAAIRFGVGGTSAVLLATTLFTGSWNTTSELSEYFATLSPVTSVLALQIFLIVVSAPALLLAAAMRERERATLELQTSEARYRDLVESQTEMICRYLPDTTLTFVNDAFCRWYRKSQEALIGNRFVDLLDEAEREHHLQYLAALLAHPETTVDEHEVKLPDGSVGWQQWVDHVIYDAQGKIAEVQAIGRDITERKRAETALRESEDRFHTMANTAPVLIWESDTAALTTFVNVPWLAFTGRTIEQELGNGWADGVHRDDYQRCQETYLAAFRSRQSFTMEYRLRRHDGEYRWILDKGVPRFTPDGSFIGFIGIALDITERKQMEQENQASEARYRDLVESQSAMICRYLPDGTLTFVNDAYSRHFGRPREALIGTRFVDLLPGPQAERARTNLLRFMWDPDTITDEHEVTLPDGTQGWQRWIEHPIRTADGTVNEIQAVGQDVTERRLAEEALRASEERYRAVVETQTELISRYRPDTTLTFVNDAHCRYYGKSREEMLGARFLDYLPESAHARVEATIQSLLEHPGVLTIEHEAFLPDGSLRWQQWVNRSILDPDGKVVELQGIGRDITELKQALDALERLSGRLLRLQDEERRRLARELHDGTAQNVVAINLNLTNLRALVADEDHDHAVVTRLLAESQMLSEQALREMRTLSYLLHPPQLDEKGLIPALKWYVRGFSQRSGIRVDLLAPPNLGRLPAEVERVLFRVVQECLTNVHRHSGSATARIVMRQVDDTVRLLVSDRGSGIHAKAETDEQKEAPDDVALLGVGIPGMRQRLRQLGGQLTIRSGRRGTTVMAVVPVAQDASALA